MSMWNREELTEILAQNQMELGSADPEMVVALANDAGEDGFVSEGRVLGVWFDTQRLDSALEACGCEPDLRARSEDD